MAELGVLCNLTELDFNRAILILSDHTNIAVTVSRSLLHIFHTYVWWDTCNINSLAVTVLWTTICELCTQVNFQKPWSWELHDEPYPCITGPAPGPSVNKPTTTLSNVNVGVLAPTTSILTILFLLIIFLNRQLPAPQLEHIQYTLHLNHQQLHVNLFLVNTVRSLWHHSPTLASLKTRDCVKSTCHDQETKFICSVDSSLHFLKIANNQAKRVLHHLCTTFLAKCWMDI